MLFLTLQDFLPYGATQEKYVLIIEIPSCSNNIIQYHLHIIVTYYIVFRALCYAFFFVGIGGFFIVYNL